MLGKPHVFVVHGFLGRGVWKCESRSCVLPIHEESGCFAGCVSCGTKDGRRQITHHDSSVVTSDDSPGISRKGYTAKIHTGIDERQEGGSVLVCKVPLRISAWEFPWRRFAALVESALLPLFSI